MSKGFLVVAQNTSTVDYVKQAYALALSIKFSQTTYNNISIMTNDPIGDEYKSVFDQIIAIPWDDAAENATWKVENRWKVYHITPYEETIILDTDMLLLEDITKWWLYCSNYDLKFCSKIKNYKLEPVVDNVYRKAFTQNHLQNPYFALHYFKKSENAYYFYKVLEFVCNNWEWAWSTLAPNNYQNWLSMDLAAAVTIELLGLQETAVDQISPLEFIHMKPALQGWHATPEKWQDVVPAVMNSKGDLVVSNIKQSKLFHYVEKDFVNEQLLTRLKELANGKTKIQI